MFRSTIILSEHNLLPAKVRV